MPALFVVFAEHLGHLFVTSDIVGRDLIKDPGLHRSLFADGLSNMISGFAGSTPNTTYGENMGVMAMTGVYSTWVIGGAAVFAIIFPSSAKWPLSSMPSPPPSWAACAFSSSASSHPQGSACSSKKSGLHEIKKPDSHRRHHDFRIIRRNRCPGACPAERHGTCHHRCHDPLPLIPDL